MNLYDSQFYADVEKGVYHAAQHILPMILKGRTKISLLDVGCGNGVWLNIAEQLGVKDFMGVDGNYVQPEWFRADFQKFVPTDLNNPFNLNRRFDVVISFEVGEHLHATQAPLFVKSLCQHSDHIFFSAAVPGQKGVDHINEQWPSYWENLFNQNGFEAKDSIRPKIWYNPKIPYWYRQNIIEFCKKPTKNIVALGKSLDKVHPEMVLQNNKINTASEQWTRYPWYCFRRFINKHLKF